MSVFVSYNRKDIDVVRDVVRELTTKTIAIVFDKDIPPGVSWQTHLEQEISLARTVLVMLGNSGMGPWQRAEIEIAIDRALRDSTVRVIPVLLPGTSEQVLREHLFLSRYEWLDLRAGLDTAQLDHLVAVVRGERPVAHRQATETQAPPTISASRGSVAAGVMKDSIVIVGVSPNHSTEDDE